MLGCLFGGVIIFLVLTAAVLAIKDKYQGLVYPGVFVFGESVSGKNVGELEEFLSEKEAEINQQKVIFFWQNGVGEEKRWEIIPQMIGWELDKQAMINEVLTKGREGDTVGSFANLYRLLIFPLEIKPTFKYSQEKLEQIVAQMAAEVDRPVQDALFEFKQGKVINFQVSKEGREVDKKQVKSLVVLAFSRTGGGKPLVALDLPVRAIKPKITTEQSNKLGIRELLAEGESFFKDSIPSRVHNIILASSYLHGVVIPPGETFSFAQKIGTISAEVGYKPAYVIKNKATVLEDGGGVCQVSTTLFRAALNAGLPIVERQPHYYRVGFYEQGGYPPGLDATVYPPSPDLKFKNDTPAYILIQTVVDKEAKRLAFQLYGSSDGRRVEISKPVVHSQTPPPEPIYIDEPSLPAGVVKRIDSAHWGAKVSFTRKVFNADGSLKEEKTFWSNYVSWPAVYQRGVGQ
ncbi:MAG: VanW family protein [Microgenomates group bacterium]